jgi:segregation and condensation protein A
MAVSLAEEAIVLLIELAEKGEINPWDVNVIDVIDRFLTQASPTATTRDLSESGQAFLYAAMLVYLKAMALADPEPEEAPLPEDESTWAEDPLASWSPHRLEHVLQPRAVPRLTRTRPVTLKDLIRHLQELESVLKEQPEPSAKPLTQRVTRKQALAAITQLAHPENLLETAAGLESLLAQLWQGGVAHLSFERLIVEVAANPDTVLLGQGSGSHSLPSVTPHRIQLFWALLLMASRSQVELRQEQFYQDLTILPSSPAERG